MDAGIRPPITSPIHTRPDEGSNRCLCPYTWVVLSHARPVEVGAVPRDSSSGLCPNASHVVLADPSAPLSFSRAAPRWLRA